jgi:hypothetical protein
MSHADGRSDEWYYRSVSARMLLVCVCLLPACKFAVEPIEEPSLDASTDLTVPDGGSVDDLTTPPDLTDLAPTNPDLICVPNCAGGLCGQPNGCGGMCCAGSGCNTAACDPQCGTLDACGTSCSVMPENAPCTLGGAAAFCRSGVCSNKPAEFTVFGNTTPSGSVIAPDSLELGMKFTLDRAGTAAKVRFFKPTGATGGHIGHLWDNAGTLLGTTTFMNETASGWQEQPLPSPIPLAANTTYVVSYSEHGGFAWADHGFDVGRDAPPIHVPVAAGMYRNPEGTFPNMTFNNSNYSVDIVIH